MSFENKLQKKDLISIVFHFSIEKASVNIITSILHRWLRRVICLMQIWEFFPQLQNCVIIPGVFYCFHHLWQRIHSCWWSEKLAKVKKNNLKLKAEHFRCDWFCGLIMKRWWVHYSSLKANSESQQVLCQRKKTPLWYWGSKR